jgi:phosphatidylserine/phosphatidylglycerophosphate/cardiolipin synthase-like enzyme
VLFARDPGDPGQQKDISVKAVKALRDIGVHIVEVYRGHQKVIVVDEHTVMLGSLNALSHSDTREVMITTRGAHFALNLLAQLHAKEFSVPPRCGACRGDQVDLRRSESAAKDYHYYWRCYSQTCPAKGKGGSRAWTQPVDLKRSGNNP